MNLFRFALSPALLLIVPGLLFALWRWFAKSQTATGMRFSDTSAMADLSEGARVRYRRLPDLIRFLAWVALVIALAQPQIGAQNVIIETDGIDIALTLDISNSMNEPYSNDLTRFESAKQVIIEFIDKRQFDRIGFVVFSREAYYQTPPTTNYDLLRDEVANMPLASEANLASRTAIGLGLSTSILMLRNSNATSRVIILLTDGANNAGEIDPISAAQAAAAYGIRVYTIAIESASITGSGLATQTLRTIADITDGRYFDASTLDDLQEIYDEINRLETSTIEETVLVQWGDIAWWFIIPAIVFLLVERILRNTVFQAIP